MRIAFWLAMLVGVSYWFVTAYFIIKAQVKYNHEMRKIKTDAMYRNCLNVLSEMNGGEYKIFPTTYYKGAKNGRERIY